MTTFHYTEEQRDAVTQALGDEWEALSPLPRTIWFMRSAALTLITPMFSDGQLYFKTHDGYEELDTVALLVDKFRAAEDRLRAAGFVEVDE